MTLPQVTSWMFLAAFAVMFNILMLQRHTPAPPDPQEGVAQQPAQATAQSAVVVAPQPISFTRRALIVPVARVAPGALSDTWGQSRSGGRGHQGIDIMAPLGTPVLAAVDGRIVKFFNSERGGVTIYQFDASERYVYYYAHLNGRALGVDEGDVVRQGAVIGYVGQTGNAPAPHLHFEIQRLTPERRWWQAESMNPYPFLVAGRPPV